MLQGLRMTFVLLLSSFFVTAQINPQNVTIARDSFGVPHIFAPTDAEVAYGLAFAHAEDDFNSLQELIWPVKGLMGKALGKNGASGDYGFRLFRCQRTTEEQWNTLTPDFLKLIEGYVSGINDYARLHPDEVKVKGTFPITPKEYVAASVFALVIFNGADKALSQIFNNQVPDAPAPSMDNPKGSNAFAIHGNKTTTGENYLVVNAHQPNTGSQAFYEAHVCSEEGWNALGGLLAGGPAILHGVNEYLGWAHTVNYVDRVDVYQLTMHPKKKRWYQFDGEWKKLEKEKVSLRIKGIPIRVGRKVYWSAYGATMKNKQGMYSIRLGANQKIAPLQQWYQMNKAKNFTEFYKVLSQQELSMFNIIYADKNDTIFYLNSGLVPNRDAAKELNWKGTLPGNTSKTLWTEFRDIKEHPQYVNPPSGFLFNVNHSPFLATAMADNLKEKDYPAADGWENWHNNRSKRVYELMPQKDKLSMEALKAIKFDKHLPSQLAYPINVDSLMLVQVAASDTLAELIKNYQQWDRNAVADSKGAAVFLIIYRFLQKYSPRTLTKQDGYNTFSNAYNYQKKYFGRTDITLGDLQKLVRGKESFPMYGVPDVLSTEWGVQQSDGTIKVTGGDGYVMFVRFPKKGLPVIETMNMYGASSKPDNPHFADQIPRYLKQQTKPMTLDKAEVLKNAERVYHPGE
jgi:acyl-homoserine-lactone acylase